MKHSTYDFYSSSAGRRTTFGMKFAFKFNIDTIWPTSNGVYSNNFLLSTQFHRSIPVTAKSCIGIAYTNRHVKWQKLKRNRHDPQFICDECGTRGVVSIEVYQLQATQLRNISGPPCQMPVHIYIKLDIYLWYVPGLRYVLMVTKQTFHEPNIYMINFSPIN